MWPFKPRPDKPAENPASLSVAFGCPDGRDCVDPMWCEGRQSGCIRTDLMPPVRRSPSFKQWQDDLNASRARHQRDAE